MFGSILFWFIGFGLMFGIGGFVGAPIFQLGGDGQNHR